LQALCPQLSSILKRVDAVLAPEGPLIGGLVQQIVMDGAQRHGELVTDLDREASGLGEGNVMGMAGQLATDQTRLGAHKRQMSFAAHSSLRPDQELAFVDFGCRRAMSCMAV
jgi:hypothetical protein